MNIKMGRIDRQLQSAAPVADLNPGDPSRRTLLAVGILALLLLASCTSKEMKALLEPSRALGTVLAEETTRAGGSRKQVVLILPQWAATSTAGESLKVALKKEGVAIAAVVSADMGDPMGRAPIGLKATDFFAAIDKAAGAAVVVSLAGAPLLKPEEAARLSPDHPPVLVVATASLGDVMGVSGDHRQLAGLLDARVIQLAIVDGNPESGPPASGKLDAAHRLFSQHYTILRRPG